MVRSRMVVLGFGVEVVDLVILLLGMDSIFEDERHLGVTCFLTIVFEWGENKEGRGIGKNRWNWVYVMVAFEGKFTLILFWALGFGRSVVDALLI